MSVAQIAAGSALSTSVTQLFDDGKVGPKNNNNKVPKRGSTVECWASTTNLPGS